MLKWVYGDKPPSADTAQDVLLMAHMYGMTKLVDICTHVLINSLSLERIVKLAHFHKDERFAPTVWRQCEFVLLAKFDEALDSGDFLAVCTKAPDLATRVLKSQRLQKCEHK